MMTWHVSQGAETAAHPSGAHLRVVEDGPGQWRALVRVAAPPPERYRWIGPARVTSRVEAVAWCEKTASAPPPPPLPPHFRIVEESPDLFAASVRVLGPAPVRARWIGPELLPTRAEAIAWCEKTAANPPPPAPTA